MKVLLGIVIVKSLLINKTVTLKFRLVEFLAHQHQFGFLEIDDVAIFINRSESGIGNFVLIPT